MTSNRRKFITNLTAFSTSVGFSAFFNSVSGKSLLHELELNAFEESDQTVTNEEFWRTIQQAYSINANIVNLNNGGVSPSPKVVQEAVEHYNRVSNELPSYYMWQVVGKGKEMVRKKLADLAGCSPENIAINRNASEGLETVIFGLTLQKGDEIVLSKYDYPSMINAWKQREKRDGVVLKWVDFDFPEEDKSLIVSKFTNLFTKKTKVVQVTHMINWNGQVLPVREIADEAKKQGIEVLVDGAHTFAQMDFKIPDLNCDYFGTSLHKWLCAPFGTGMLYVKKDKIADLYPLFAAPDSGVDDIRKFEHLGTRSLAIEVAISHAVNFHNLIGIKRKQERLLYLKKYWMDRVKDIPGVELKTSDKPAFSGAIGFIQLKNIDTQLIKKRLYAEHNIHTVAINIEQLSGLRISPNVYTLTEDLDRFVDGLKKTLP